MNKWLITSLALALSSTMAFADTSDREKPISIEASAFKADQVNQVAIYTGNVFVRQGTLQMTGTKLVISENAKGYRQMEVFGKNAKFRQRRDPKIKGIDEWFEAEAQRLVYEESNGIITLYKNAKVARTENGIVKDQTEGERIVYDTHRSRTIIQGSSSGRASTVIAPRSKGNSSSEMPVTKLNSSTKISAP